MHAVNQRESARPQTDSRQRFGRGSIPVRGRGSNTGRLLMRWTVMMVSPEGIEAWVRRSANRLTAHDFWLQVVESQRVSHYSSFDGRSRLLT
jgi:hypothetical protein